MSFFDSLKQSKVRFPKKYRYQYPDKLDLQPDSDLHNDILKRLLSLAKSSYDVMQRRHSNWREVDRKLNVYIDLSNEEKSDKADDPRRPVSMVVPVSFATRETLLAYRMSVFLDQPIFKYSWTDPNDAIGVIMLQKIIDQQTRRKKMPLDLITLWSDDITYGFGSLGVGWERITRPVKKKYKTLFGISLETVEDQVVYEGNALYPFDPYNTLPDPKVPISRVQDMQFFGAVERTNYLDLMTYEKQNPDVFNVRYLKDFNFTKSTFYSATKGTTGRYDKTGIDPDVVNQYGSEMKTIDVLWMNVKLIPSDWKIGDNDYPEVWRFAIAGDRVIIYAKRLQESHGMLPVISVSSHSDDHTTIPLSILEIEFPLQHAIDWLWSSHVINVRKHLNNMLVVDPSLINMNDLVDTKYGMIARLRARAFGRGVKDAIMQLNMTDVTRQNVQDIGFLMNIQQRTTAATDQMQGLFAHRNDRISATEARDTRISGLSRLAKDAQIIAWQGHYDLAYMLASNTIQFMTEDIYVKTTGSYEELLRKEYGVQEEGLVVSPEALDVNFDVEIQQDNLTDLSTAEIWQRLLQVSQVSPELYQELDFTRIWLHIARLLGAKNPERFLKREKQVKVLPQNQIEQQAKAGNLVTPEQLGKTV